MEKTGGGGGGAPPATGCYKCGRPGHWSRDCPSSSSATNPNPISTSNTNPKSNTYFSGSSSSPFKNAGGGFSKPLIDKPIEKPKKNPRSRPKLTPNLLLSDDGLGYILRHFPRSFKFRGRGHEVDDLGNLIDLYTQWHHRLLPYYSFDQFVEKVEQVGATRQVRTCVRELRDRVSHGGDPSKLHEPPVHLNEPVEPTPEPENANNLENPIPDVGDSVLETHHDMDVEEEMLDEVYQAATTETSHPSPHPVTTSTAQVPSDRSSSLNKLPNQPSDNGASGSSTSQLSDEQKARIEANRLKALERAAARAALSQAG
ncbi:TIMELESS-interacting protein-like [Papaver somniferum]|nr:TIMELESS-interacting protein-like [Papaver somniferum]